VIIFFFAILRSMLSTQFTSRQQLVTIIRGVFLTHCAEVILSRVSGMRMYDSLAIEGGIASRCPTPQGMHTVFNSVFYMHYTELRMDNAIKTLSQLDNSLW